MAQLVHPSVARSSGSDQPDLLALPQFDAQYHDGFTRLIWIIALCWLLTIPAFYLLDRVFVTISPNSHILPLLFYVLNGANALFVLCIALWPRAQRWLGRAFLPVVVCCMSIVPLLITPLVTPFGVGPITGIRGLIHLRFAPVLLIGVLLVAWNYPWKYALMLNLLIPLLTIGPALLHTSLMSPTVGSSLIQTMGFLIISYCVYMLLARLRAQGSALQEANRQLRSYASTLESLTISRERNRMARELHDTLAHTLSSLTVQLETTKAYWERDPKAAYQMVDRALTVTRSGLKETRRALDALRASPIDDLGLRLALSDLLESIAEVGNLELQLEIAELLPVLESATEQAIYRIAQEAATNIAHHAEASRLIVQLNNTNSHLHMRIQDDGRGFDLGQGRQAGHFGLAGMYERARLIGGQLNVSSSPGAGTLVELSLPLEGGIS